MVPDGIGCLKGPGAESASHSISNPAAYGARLVGEPFAIRGRVKGEQPGMFRRSPVFWFFRRHRVKDQAFEGEPAGEPGGESRDHAAPNLHREDQLLIAL